MTQGLMEGLGTPEDKRAKLLKDFIVPPFSVLDTRQGYWQERKRLWLSLGIKSELGRGGMVKRCLDDGSWQGEHAYDSRANIGVSKHNTKAARAFGVDIMKGEKADKYDESVC